MSLLVALAAVVVVALGAITSTAVIFWRLLRLQQQQTDTANDRLYAAWKDNYNIPAEQSAITDKKVIEDVAEPLIEPLQALVDDWEDERGKDSQRKYIRSLIDGGKTQAEVARMLRPELFADSPND